MSWRVAESLEVLRKQFNSRYPNRNKASDGGIGDAAHATRDSDHNPWFKKGGMGIVTARDFTHDPAHGMDIDRLTDELAASRDPRIKYVIANNMILDSRPGMNPWRWMPYYGSNPHTRHFHLSVNTHNCDDARPWNLPSFGGKAPAPHRPSPGGIETMGFNDTYKDWAGNKQSVLSWMNHVDKRVFNLTKDMDFLTNLVRRYTADQSLAVQLPAHPEMLTEQVMLPPKNGVVTGNQGRIYVSLSAGEDAEIEEVFFIQDWNADGKPGKKTQVQGRYTLVAGDRQSFSVPGAATMFCVRYQSRSTLAVGAEVDAKWK